MRNLVLISLVFAESYFQEKKFHRIDKRINFEEILVVLLLEFLA